jgi:hypothetical protein
MRLTTIFSVVLAALSCAFVDAATISGRFTYDGVDVNDVFGPPLTATVRAYDFTTTTSYMGTVNVSAGTYIVTDVPVGDGAVQLEIDRGNPPDGSAEEPGDLESIWGYYTITDAGESLAMDLQMLYMLHATAPVDTAGQLDGYASQCPSGPQVGDVFTLVWDPVPRATTYNVQVLRFDCDYTFTGDWLTTTANSIEIEIGTAGEDFIKIQFFVAGQSVSDLATWPYIQYLDGSANGFFLHGGGGSQPLRDSHPPNSYVIPAVANAGGAQGTFWTTALTVFNPIGSPRTVEAFYTPRGSDGTTDYVAAGLELGASSSTTWENVVGTVFGTSGAGSLEVRGGDIIVSSRTSTPGLEGGSYGQGIPPVAPYHVMRIGGAQVQWAGGVVRSPAYRTNLGLCEVWGEDAQVRVTLWGEDGSAAGTRTIDLPPFGNSQINDLPHTLGGLDQMENGMVELEILGGDGRVGAYLSIVDNVTGDPTYVPVGFSPPSTAE